ncbi:MAG: glycosyltransferase [Gemmatimonadota bacterium]|nr:MAG: glycosyltransferase [Gemmatimonadota bacterium]
MTRPVGLGMEPEIDFHVLSFEGPDVYARAGGIASRISGLTLALSEEGFETHLWFIGDPGLPAQETGGSLTLHRWCQWISHHHPGGVYDGEDGKRSDYSASLPPALVRDHLAPRLEHPGRWAVVLAEEWQTVDAVVHLDALLRVAGLRDRVAILWNANNVFGFERIDWQRLAAAATITTVSRYMRHLMWKLGVDPLVIPNGIPVDYLEPPERRATAAFRQTLADRLVLTKVARWDPDKRWLLAIDIVAELKRHGWRPLLIARGGVEAHEAEVFARAAAIGLHVLERPIAEHDERSLIATLSGLGSADVVSLTSYLTPRLSRLLFRGSAAVLANSGREPFGLVGLETMAANGIACVGGTGEDYAVPGWNALLLQTNDPREFLGLFQRLLANPDENRAIRTRAGATARRYTWNQIIRRDLLPRLYSLVSDGQAFPAPGPGGARRHLHGQTTELPANDPSRPIP